jgi:hypothetical protein
MEFGFDHVNSRCVAVARVVEEIATHSDLCAVGVLLLRAIIYADSHVCDIAFAVIWNVLAADEDDSVSTFADSGDDLSKAFEFFLPHSPLDLGLTRRCCISMRWPLNLSRTAWSMSEGYCCSAVRRAVAGRFVNLP